jgi:hypothetical protein
MSAESVSLNAMKISTGGLDWICYICGISRYCRRAVAANGAVLEVGQRRNWNYASVNGKLILGANGADAKRFRTREAAMLAAIKAAK